MGLPCLGLDPGLQGLPECPWPLDTCWMCNLEKCIHSTDRQCIQTMGVFIAHKLHLHKLSPVQVTSVIQQPEKFLFNQGEKEEKHRQIMTTLLRKTECW